MTSSPKTYTEALMVAGIKVHNIVGDGYGDSSNWQADRLIELRRLMGLDLTGDLSIDFRGEGDEVAKMIMIGQWAEWGFNVFDLTDSLASALLLTESSSDASFPHLPFPAFLIRLPSGLIPMYVEQDGRETMEWVQYVWINLLCLDGQNVLKLEIGPHDHTKQTWFTSIYEEGFKGFYNHCEEVSLWVTDPENPHEMQEDGLMTLQAVTRLFGNFCSWLESIGGTSAQEPANQNRISRKREEEAPRMTQWIVGREVKLDPEMRQAAREQVIGRSKHAIKGWRQRASWITRGHTRLQACGKGYQEHKKIWIQPHWNLKEKSVQWAHIYKSSNGT